MAALLATPACAVATHHPRTVSYDYSDADHYDVKHAPSPDYRVEAPAPTGSKARKRRPIVVEIVRGR